MAKIDLKREPNTLLVLIKSLLDIGKRYRNDLHLKDILDPLLLARIDHSGIDELLGQISDSDLDATNQLFDATRTRLSTLLESLSTRDLEIATERIFRESQRPRTLDALGNQFDVTRERIRQIQNTVERRINSAIGNELKILGIVARLELGPILEKDDFDQTLTRIFPVGEMEYNAERTRKLIIAEARYKVRNGVLISPTALEIANRMVAYARKIADQVAIVDESKLREEFTEELATQSWDLLCRACGFHRLSGRLGLRQSGVARVKAAILNIGRPATVDEISKETGIVADKLLRTIITNNSYFVRSDKKRWGLRESIPKVYRGISTMIKARIEADGGSSSLSQILEEFPAQYGVKKISVNAYAHTMQYKIDGDRISIADSSDLSLRPLDEIISGRDSRGYAYWSFPVAEPYFRGYSILGVPAEIANALGCQPNDRMDVRVSSPPDCRDLSLIWRLDSTTGASLGYTRTALRALDFQPSDTAHLVILPDHSVEIRKFIL